MKIKGFNLKLLFWFSEANSSSSPSSKLHSINVKGKNGNAAERYFEFKSIEEIIHT